MRAGAGEAKGGAMNQIDLAGRKAIVTGAARGIGRAIAERLLQSGAELGLWDVDAAAVEEAAQALAGRGKAHPTVVDVCDETAVAAAAAAATARCGRVDILVNNAGISGVNKPTWEYPVEE